MANVLITGTSGLLGPRLLEEIPESRSAEVDESTDFVSLLDDVDIVIFFAARVASPLAIRKLLDALPSVDVKHIVFGSSSSVYGAWAVNSVPLTEDAPLRPNPGFVQAVEIAEQERVVADWKAAHDAPTISVMRYALLAGSETASLVLGRFDWHRNSELSSPVQLLHVDDGVSATLHAMNERLDGVFNVSPPDFISEATARAIAGGPPRPALPRQVAHFANDVTWRRRRYRSDFAAAAHYFEHPWVVSSEKLQSTGWVPEFTSEEVVASNTTPTVWNRLRPQQRRDLVNASLLAGGATGAVTAVGGATWALARKRRR